MSSLAGPAAAPIVAAPGRPLEIEEWSNRRLIHPLSRGLVGWLIPTGISPNTVSIMGAGAAAAAACAFWLAAWPANAFLGGLLLVGWHVLDGADGDLARRTGRASTNGELVDGICDHLGQLAIYLAFALILWPRLGAWALVLATASGLSRAVQASAYEGARRNYRRWVDGARWIRQNLSAPDLTAAGPMQRLKVGLGLGYVAVSRLVSADDRALEAAMDAQIGRGGEAAARARGLYQASLLPLVKRAALLSANYRSLAIFVSMLAGAPALFLLYEIVVLNLGLAWLAAAQARAHRTLIENLAGVEPAAA